MPTTRVMATALPYFLGDGVTVGFYFCTKESPFRLTVMCIGGGGWVGLRASPKGLVLLEMGLEACACLSVDLGVASGSVSISVGVYLRLEADKPVEGFVVSARRAPKTATPD